MANDVLAERCKEAAAAYDRILNMTEAAADTSAMAAALVLALHGHLFGECAKALAGEQVAS